ncbi:MAG: molecular chaperone HtpG [Succinivibrionaceae bacterium]|nr:molecular chaperone HtpG [Succinivibrionaceae bacterium]
MTAEKHVFQTEVKKMLDLLANSLYSNKEVFLRELVSNASDAADKLRFNALSNASLYGDDAELKIRVSADRDAKTITISDNGIGMTKEEAIQHLGTIANSGTAEFFGNLSGDASKDSQLIGQFGVGFYSSFIVADKVTVKSRAAGVEADKAVCWESTGDGTFETSDITKETRGTEVVLHLKESETEFLSSWKLEDIIKKYSDHIGIPVEIYKEVRDEDAPEEKDAEGNPVPPKMIWKWVQINSATALWTKNPKDVSDEDYKNFYNSISGAYQSDEPLAWAHNKVEGTMEYTSLLYIPPKAPWDLFNRENKHGLKLYVQRVFIMDDAEQFMPTYLRFVKGLLDSNDLPLNVSREILQDNKITSQLRKACTKRVLGMLSKMAKDEPEKYKTFWTQFGAVMKEGPAEDYDNREEIQGLLRFASTSTQSSDQSVSLDDYISRMPEKQKNIYYLVGESYNAVANNTHLEALKSKGIEVLLMWDRVDEWLMAHMTDYKDKRFISASASDLELGDLENEEDKKKAEEQSKEFESTLKRFKEALGDSVTDVKVSTRLVDTPCLVISDNSVGAHMANIFKAMGQPVPETKYSLELNMDHPLVKRVVDEPDDDRFKDWAKLLFGQAKLAEVGSLDNPSEFIKLLDKFLV